MVERTNSEIEVAIKNSPLGEEFYTSGNALTKYLAKELALVWFDFDKKLSQIPIIQNIETETITLQQYKDFLVNLRQQVIEGGRWLSQAASSMEIEYFPIRSALIKHAAAEHQDYKMLESDYVECGGDISSMLKAEKNVGSEALSSFIFFRARTINPMDLFGSIFVIEGLGSQKAKGWGEKIQKTLSLSDNGVRFLSYHGENDEDHYKKLKEVLTSPFINQENASRLIKTAKITARLYALQLEEINNF